MKLNINLGDDLKNAKITHRKEVPVLHHFNHDRFIGMAYISDDLSKAEVKLVYPLNTNVELIKDILELRVAGKILSHKDNVITKFELTNVSINFRE
jgi:hypothetical protein